MFRFDRGRSVSYIHSSARRESLHDIIQYNMLDLCKTPWESHRKPRLSNSFLRNFANFAYLLLAIQNKTTYTL
jgi:hypothetical protein